MGEGSGPEDGRVVDVVAVGGGGVGAKAVVGAGSGDEEDGERLHAPRPRRRRQRRLPVHLPVPLTPPVHLPPSALHLGWDWEKKGREAGRSPGEPA